jgi:anhydro-N-acetylmuramic acid kinase
MPELYIGLISGTSTDGVDAALVDLSEARPQLVASELHPYDPILRRRLQQLALDPDARLDFAAALDIDTARAFAAAARALLEKARTEPSAVRAIGSHGQTVRHFTQGPRPFTVQLGDPNVIAELTGITTVADFRRRDLAAGGEGAPLVPAFHAATLQVSGETRVVLNIGGIANITLLPADPGQPALGFDTGPGNTLLDAWSLHRRQEPVDRDGAWAASGRVDEALLARLLQDRYFAATAPKSTGVDHFNLAWLGGHLEGGEIDTDVQATLCELTVRSIAEAIERHAAEAGRVLVCGGGVHNRELMNRLSQRLAGRRVESTAAEGLDPDWVEAMAFAWLARETLAGRPGNLPSVTGASGPRVLGGVYRGSV